ncbi:hypothetical protein KSP40_PGU016984 [Platanthera guangdongensis]|uniref:Uncharacterized protein n=1 Tax=Platanthera guangdongensis TaxID=2320717 RepID=A0ABR2LRL8_9ASPA
MSIASKSYNIEASTHENYPLVQHSMSQLYPYFADFITYILPYEIQNILNPRSFLSSELPRLTQSPRVILLNPKRHPDIMLFLITPPQSHSAYLSSCYDFSALPHLAADISRLDVRAPSYCEGHQTRRPVLGQKGRFEPSLFIPSIAMDGSNTPTSSESAIFATLAFSFMSGEYLVVADLKAQLTCVSQPHIFSFIVVDYNK